MFRLPPLYNSSETNPTVALKLEEYTACLHRYLLFETIDMSMPVISTK